MVLFLIWFIIIIIDWYFFDVVVSYIVWYVCEVLWVG